MALPIFKSDDTSLSLLQTTWAAQLNPLLNNAPNNGMLLKNVSLVSGANVVNHLLGKKLQGWCIVRQRSAASVYDTQDNNNIPTLTLQLTASANVNVDLYVF